MLTRLPLLCEQNFNTPWRVKVEKEKKKKKERKIIIGLVGLHLLSVAKDSHMCSEFKGVGIVVVLEINLGLETTFKGLGLV